jgi:hypothetical protein
MQRRVTIGLVLGVCLWAVSADARVGGLGPPVNGGGPGACCQFGTTYGPLATAVSCNNVGPGPGLNLCALSGGTLVSGTCHSDGTCGGSTVCCAVVQQACSGLPTASPCAPATEDACDAIGPAGVQTTFSFPSTVCLPQNGVPTCVQPNANP